MASVHIAVQHAPAAVVSVVAEQVAVWQLRVGDIVAVPGHELDGPRRIVSVAVLPGMRKLFLGWPQAPAPPGRLTAPQLRGTPSCTLGDDVEVQLIKRP